MKRVLAEVKKIEGDAPAEWYHGEALRLIWKGKRGDAAALDTARGLLTKAAARRPDWHAVFVARGEIDQLQNKPEQAIVNYRKAAEMGSRDATVMRQLVALLSEAQRFEEAEQEIRKMQQQVGASTELQRLAVAVSFNRRDYVRAGELARRSVRPDSTDYREHLWVGQVLSARGQASDDAEKAFRKAVALGEKQPETWVALVRYLVATGQPVKAGNQMKAAAEKLDDAQRPLALAQCYEITGDATKAVEFYREAIKQQPDSVVVRRAAAECFVRVGNLRDAEAAYRHVIDRKLKATDDDVTAARYGLALTFAKTGSPKLLPEALQLVGLALDKTGNLSGNLASQPAERLAQARVLATFGHHALRARAIAVLDELYQKAALAADDQFLLARLLHQHGADPATWRKTQDVLKGLTTNYPHNPRYVGYHANVLLLRKEVAEAEPLVARLAQIEKDRRLTPGTLGAVELQARVLELRGKEKEAVALLKGFAEQDGAQPARTFLLASLHGRLGNFAEAIDLCDQVRRAGRRDEAFGIAVGILRSARPEPTQQAALDRWTAQLRRVEESVRESLKLDAENVSLRLQLADLVELQGKFGEVEAICRQVLAQDKGNLVALNNLAWLLSHQPGKADEALGYINRAIEQYGPRADLLDTRAVVYLNLGRNDQSVRDLEKVVQEAPTPARLFHLTRAHHQAHNSASALTALQRANDLGLNVQQLHPSEHDAYRRVVAELQKR
jgi:tetratricopeptide (TPR) repeat protein